MSSIKQVKAIANLISTIKAEGFTIDLAQKIFADSAIQPHHAEEVIFLARESGSQSPQLYELYLNFNASKGEVANVEKVIELATQENLQSPDWATYTAHAHAVRGNLQKAWSILDTLKGNETSQLIPSSLPDLIQHSARNPEFSRRGYNLFQDALRAGIAFNNQVRSEVVRGLRRDGEIDRMLAFLRVMRERGEKLDAMTYHFILSGMHYAGAAIAREVLREVLLHGVVSYSVAFNKSIQEFAAKGDMQGAMEIFEDMKSEQVNGQTMTYNLLIKGFVQNGKKDAALGLVREMMTKQIYADVNTYLPILTGLIKELKEAKDTKAGKDNNVEENEKAQFGIQYLLRQMKQHNVEINVQRYNMLSGDVRMTGGQRALDLLQDLLSQGRREQVEEEEGRMKGN